MHTRSTFVSARWIATGLAVIALLLARCSDDAASQATGANDVDALAADAGKGDVITVADTPDTSTPDIVADAAAPPDVPVSDGSATDVPTPSDTPDVAVVDVPIAVDTTDAATPVDVPQDTGPPPPPPFDPSTITQDLPLFPFGVQSADATPDGALLWTRYVDTAELRAVVFEDGEGDAPGAVVAEVIGEPADGGFVEVEVTGLEPLTRYRYAFTTDDEPGSDKLRRSAVGRFVTAPSEDDLVPIAFGGVSCIKESVASLAPIAQAAEDSFDFFLYLGDTVYADEDDATTVAEYREEWGESYITPEYRTLHAGSSAIYTWDDHEVTNNWDGETVDPDMLAAARAVFYEHAPLRKDPEHPDRIWRSLRWGRTVEVFVLDCRGERKPSTKDTADAEYISPEQEQWLIDGVTASDATFKLILSSVPITNMPPVYVKGEDRWEGYPAQREAVLSALQYVPGVLWISGDFHFPMIGRIEPPGQPYDNVYEVLVGPGAQIPNPAWLVVANGLMKDQFLYVGGDNNYTRFLADPLAKPPAITVEYVSGKGEVIHSETLSF